MSHFIINTVKNFIKKLHFIFFKCLLCFKHYEVNQSLIISSETRGGSTWLMEILPQIDGVVTNWEPLHVNYGVVPKSLKWGWHPYLKDLDSEAKPLIENMLSLRIYTQWTLNYNRSITGALGSKLVLTKFCRANLLLPLIVSQFRLQHKPIYLVRHPIAVVLSQIDLFFSDLPFTQFVVPDCINNERYQLHVDYLNSLDSMLERRIALWCMRNVEIINHPQRQQWIQVFYEDLVLNPKQTIQLITSQWHLNLDTKNINFSKTSSTTDLKSFQTDKMKQLSKWKNKLNANDLLNIQKIFDKFNLKTYSTHSVLPLKSQI